MGLDHVRNEIEHLFTTVTRQQVLEAIGKAFPVVVDLFKRILHAMEAVLFKVDEWLRFRGGDSKWAMSARIVLGLLWFPISYLARFNMVVFIEPAINPVKLPVCSIATACAVATMPRWWS